MEIEIKFEIKEKFEESKKKIPILFYELKHYENSKRRFILNLKKPINKFYIKEQLLITQSGNGNNFIIDIGNEIEIDQFDRYFGVDSIEIVNRALIGLFVNYRFNK